MNPTTTQTHQSRQSVLLVGADPHLLQDVTRLAAAAAVVPDVVGDPLAALAAWPHAGTVLVGADVLGAVSALDPPRRQGVHVVSRGELSAEGFRDALRIGAQTVGELPSCETWLVELLTDAGDGVSAGGAVIGVTGGSGGVGSSVFAAALAETIAMDHG
ncbi:MAG: septum site-determining protein minD, partial [Myxococcales bacterium]